MSEQSYHDPREAFEYLLAHGAVRYDREGAVTHLPCSLSPWKAPAAFVEETQQLTPFFTDLYHRVAQDDDFLHTELGAARMVDPFIARLFHALEHEAEKKPCLYLNRNDCMPSLLEDGKIWPKQVEMNLMASALGEASSIVTRMHRFLGQHQEVSLLDNRAGEGLAQALAEGYRALGGQGVVLFLVPTGEVSVFDQRILESRLVERYQVPTLRATLEELGDEGELRQGQLWFRGFHVSIAYFRTGYAPYHYPVEAAWTARNLIEASSAVSVPSARTQLANTKLIQLLLASEENLQRFVPAQAAQRLAKACVAFSKLDEPYLEHESGKDAAISNPDAWVLKPHREGGGNNFFSAQMVEKLKAIDEAESEAYILMEKIRPPVFESVKMVDREALPCRCVTELGFFGTAFYPEPGGASAFNRSQGYLLRTKDEGTDEGLVLGGFSFLDSVALP